MSYRLFLEEIKKGLPSRTYLLVSSDPFLHHEAVHAVKGLVPDPERDFSFHTFDLMNTGGSSIPFEQILDVLNTAPFFSGRKFVVIGNFQKLVKKDLKKLDAYLLAPAETTVLVLLHEGTVKKDFKEGLTGVKQITLDIGERDMPAWLKAKAEQKGFQLSDKAADYLLGLIGPDLGLLSSEIDKCTLIGKSVIEKDDIAAIAEGKRMYNAFALIDAIRARDPHKVFAIYRVLRDTEEPYSLLGALNWQYGKSLAEKLSPLDRTYYQKVFEILHKADANIKTSGGAYPVELLLVKLLRLSRKR